MKESAIQQDSQPMDVGFPIQLRSAICRTQSGTEKCLVILRQLDVRNPNLSCYIHLDSSSSSSRSFICPV
ncbi:hypothetical protein AOLI_G00094180 [Acnodon oligacanthus]